MRIVIAHNRYKYLGGEDSVVAAEAAMLRRGGNDVELLTADNRSIQGPLTKIAAVGSLFHSPGSCRRLTELIETFKPDILHIHNWFPLLSPGIIHTAHSAGIPVVQTLHNYRMICVNSALFREGRVCLDCVGKSIPVDGAVHGCYTGSRVGSALVAAAYSIHRIANTWDEVAKFIAVSEFQKDLLIRGGLQPAQIVVKPNFVFNPGAPGDGSGGYALFVGRMTEQKGIRSVLQAWEGHGAHMPLKILGDGPLAGEVRERAAKLPNVEYLGQRGSSEVAEAMRYARFLIFASRSYETSSLTIMEAFSQGTPVLATTLGPIAALVDNGVTGLRFDADDPVGLAAKAKQLFAGGASYQDMRRNCRAIYEERYAEPQNYEMLTSIYRSVIGLKHSVEKPAGQATMQRVSRLNGEAL